jgi:N-acetylglucosamine-6-sulfatase
MANSLSRRCLLGAPLAAYGATTESRPNVVFVLVDDLRWDELGCTGHPFASTPHVDRVAREGANFRNAFASTPLCSPSRAAFLTGAYSHANGVIDNVARDALSHRLVTWPRLLHDAGYRTAFMGKWHMGNDDSPRPGFDHWVSFRGQGAYNNPALNVDGRSRSSEGYITDILTNYAVDFIRGSRSQPFCLYVAHKAIHPNTQQRDDGSRADPSQSDAPEAFIPADRHKNLYVGAVPPRRGNYLKRPHGKPALQRHLAGVPPLGPDTATKDAVILARMRTMKAVDDSLGHILAALEARQVLDNTIVIFTSDHGFAYGEHCLGVERRLAYEETIRIPLLVRFPRRFRPKSTPSQFLLNVDVAASVLALAGITAPESFHGRPFWATPHRDAVLIEYFSDTTFPRIRNMGYYAARTQRWKYIQYRDLEGADELYDLSSDPFELNNVISEKTAPLQQIRQRLNMLLREFAAPT